MESSARRIVEHRRAFEKEGDGAEGGRLPPQSLDAERSVLGAMLLSRDAIAASIQHLDERAFYRETHRKVWKAMVSLFDRNEAVDLVTLVEELKRRKELEAIGGATYLTSLDQFVATAANVEHYCKIVNEKATLRRLIDVGTEIVGECYDQREEPASLLDRAEQAIFAISDDRLRTGFHPMRQLVLQGYSAIEEYRQRKVHVTGVPSGFYDLDEMTAGFQKSDFVVIAGRPSMGKTSLAMNIAENVAVHQKPAERQAIALFSLEMSKESLVQRLMCAVARVDIHKIRRGYASNEEYKRLQNAAAQLHEAPIYIDDTAAMSILEMRAKARRLVSEVPLGMILIDYLQLIRGPEAAENRQQEISAISRSLKALAKELRIPVIALSQLSRAVETRGGSKRPVLSDLRECVTGDTLVVLADGRRVPIRDLIGRRPEVWALGSEDRLVPAPSDKVWSVGIRQVLAIKLASGRSARVTGRHRMYGASGWVCAEDLKVGDRLALARKIPEPADPKAWPEHQLVLLGHLVGDGSYLKHQPLRYTTASEENSAAVEQAARAFGATVTRYAGRGQWHQLVISGNGDRWNPRGVGKWLKELGVFDQRSHEKRLPAGVFQIPDAQIGLLLRHLWATDGCIFVRGAGQEGSPRAYFSTCSETLAGDVAALLGRLGIVARIRVLVKANARPVHTVDVSGSEEQRLFLERVGAFGPRRVAAAQLAAVLREVDGNTNVDTLPHQVFAVVQEEMRQQGVTTRAMASMRGTAYGGSAHFRFAPSRAVLRDYAEKLDSKRLRSLCESTLFWDRVVAIEPAGEEEVFDLTVPGPSSWLADGIVSHNSGAIEQDADVVLFVYRPEVYETDPAKRDGKAEIIIAKQRNGPTGSVDLAFLSECTRFESLRNVPEP